MHMSMDKCPIYADMGLNSCRFMYIKVHISIYKYILDILYYIIYISEDQGLPEYVQ